MARPTYTTRAIVIKKTKLGESDLILTLLAQDGAQLRVIAKGARKPQSPFASRLELFAVSDLLCSKGKNLDIVCEARLVEGNESLRKSIEHTTAASPLAELLVRATQSDLENPQLFACTNTALSVMNESTTQSALNICAASLLKSFAFLGLRPSLNACALCNVSYTFENKDLFVHKTPTLSFSFLDGGLVCKSCECGAEYVSLPLYTLADMRFYMGNTFSSIADSPIEVARTMSVLKVCQQWSQEHVGAKIKSLEFLFTSGLF